MAMRWGVGLMFLFLLVPAAGVAGQEACPPGVIERHLAGTGLSAARLARGGPFVAMGSGLAEAMRRAGRLDRAVRALPWGNPLPDFRLSSGFGPRRDPIRHRRGYHTGIDLRAALRAPVHATAAGKVVVAGRRGGYGRMVEIDHGYGVRTRYAHLSALRVRKGQQVVPGQVVGLVGSSGRSTGIHLHYEVVVGRIPRNPLRFIHRRLPDCIANEGVDLKKEM